MIKIYKSYKKKIIKKICETTNFLRNVRSLAEWIDEGDSKQITY